MIQQAFCKFCKKPGYPIVDDAYAALGDPFNLLKLYACNRCADHQTEVGRVMRRVKMFCELLIQKAVGPEDRPKVQESLETLIKRYMRLYAEHYDLSLPMYDSAIVHSIMHSPTNFAFAMRDIPKLFQQRSML